MAQSRILSVVSKHEEMINEIRDMEKNVSKLLKEATQLRRKFLGNRGKKSDVAKNKINSEDIISILQDSQNLDNLILKIQNLLHKCNTLSYYIQRQLELRNYQNQTSPPLYM